MSVALDVLGELARTPMTREILERTRVGKCINEVRKAPACEKQFARRCRMLINAWQSLLAAPSGEAVVAENWQREQDAAAGEPNKAKRAKTETPTPDDSKRPGATGAENGGPHTPANGRVGNGATINGVGPLRHDAPNNGSLEKRPTATPTYVATARIEPELRRPAEPKSISATPSPAAAGSKPPRANSTVDLLAKLCSANSEVKRIVDASQTAQLVLNNRIAIERDEPEVRSTPASPGAGARPDDKSARRSRKINKTQSVIPPSEPEAPALAPSPSLPKLCIKLAKGAPDSDSLAPAQSVFRFDGQPPSTSNSSANSPLLPSELRKYPDVEDDDDVIDLTFQRGHSDDEKPRSGAKQQPRSKGSKSKVDATAQRKTSTSKSGNRSGDTDAATATATSRANREDSLLQRALRNATKNAVEYDAKREEAKRLGALDLDAIDWHSLDYSLDTLYADSRLAVHHHALGVLQPADVFRLPAQPHANADAESDSDVDAAVGHRRRPASSSIDSTYDTRTNDAGELDNLSRTDSETERRGARASESGSDADHAAHNEHGYADRWPPGPCSPLSDGEVKLVVDTQWPAVNGTRDAAACWRPWTAAYTMPSHTVGGTNAKSGATISAGTSNSASGAADDVVVVMPYVALDRFEF